MLKLIAFAALLAVAAAECPNKCSGHGSCGEGDMCTCYSNWQANDCSERTCPFAHAFATSPQGDLNMDGDTYDNSQKLLVKQNGGMPNTGTMTETDDTLTLNTAITTNELIVGDAVMVAGESFVITSVMSSTTFGLDHDAHTAVPTSNVFKFLESIPRPKGTWESWVGDYYDGDDEGHYYMECSNRGSCDRKEGVCECYEGYTGSACQRQACPGADSPCSGHGTCETVSELASLSPVALSFTAFSGSTAADSVAGKAATNVITASADVSSSLAVGDTIRLGSPDGQDLVIEKIEASAYSVANAKLTVSAVTGAGHPHGTTVYHVPAYTLWDASKDRACKCDSSFTGIDCSSRKCPVGDDPLTKTTTPTSTTTAGSSAYAQKNEKQTIVLETMRGSLSGTFTLTYTDAFGGSWTTEPIAVNQRLASKAYVSSADPTVVTFSPALPYGELSLGDFLMIGDERHEVTTAFPEPTAMRPIKLGGVVDSVKVMNGFAAASTNAPCFRAGPAKGIKAALEALPNGVVESVTTEPMNGGTLLGYHYKGISSATVTSAARNGFTARNTVSQKITTIAGFHGSSAKQGASNAAAEGTAATQSAVDGGVAPYDTIRVVAANGKSEYCQVTNVDVTVTDNSIGAIQCKGTLASQSADSATNGIGQGKTGAVFRAGGHTVRVSFDSNPGDLEEMEVDTDGLYSAFTREFTGTVTAAEPSKVVAKLHGGDDFDAAAAYPTPAPYEDGLVGTSRDADAGGLLIAHADDTAPYDNHVEGAFTVLQSATVIDCDDASDVDAKTPTCKQGTSQYPCDMSGTAASFNLKWTNTLTYETTGFTQSVKIGMGTPKATSNGNAHIALDDLTCATGPCLGSGGYVYVKMDTTSDSAVHGVTGTGSGYSAADVFTVTEAQARIPAGQVNMLTSVKQGATGLDAAAVGTTCTADTASCVEGVQGSASAIGVGATFRVCCITDTTKKLTVQATAPGNGYVATEVITIKAAALAALGITADIAVTLQAAATAQITAAADNSGMKICSGLGVDGNLASGTSITLTGTTAAITPTDMQPIARVAAANTRKYYPGQILSFGTGACAGGTSTAFDVVVGAPAIEAKGATAGAWDRPSSSGFSDAANDCRNPQAASDQATCKAPSDVTLGDTTLFRGNEANLKLMAGMKVVVGGQQRTVVSDIASRRTTFAAAKSTTGAVTGVLYENTGGARTAHTACTASSTITVTQTSTSASGTSGGPIATTDNGSDGVFGTGLVLEVTFDANKKIAVGGIKVINGGVNFKAGDAITLKDAAPIDCLAADEVLPALTVDNIANPNAAQSSGSASDDDAATFYVDTPFARSAASETVDGVDYIFYGEPVEQVYDEATYGALTLSQAIDMPATFALNSDNDHARGSSASYRAVATYDADLDTANKGYDNSGTCARTSQGVECAGLAGDLADYLAPGDVISCSGFANADYDGLFSVQESTLVTPVAGFSSSVDPFGLKFAGPSRVGDYSGAITNTDGTATEYTTLPVKTSASADGAAKTITPTCSPAASCGTGLQLSVTHLRGVPGPLKTASLTKLARVATAGESNPDTIAEALKGCITGKLAVATTATTRLSTTTVVSAANGNAVFNIGTDANTGFTCAGTGCGTGGSITLTIAHTGTPNTITAVAITGAGSGYGGTSGTDLPVFTLTPAAAATDGTMNTNAANIVYTATADDLEKASAVAPASGAFTVGPFTATGQTSGDTAVVKIVHASSVVKMQFVAGDGTYTPGTSFVVGETLRITPTNLMAGPSSAGFGIAGCSANFDVTLTQAGVVGNIAATTNAVEKVEVTAAGRGYQKGAVLTVNPTTTADFSSFTITLSEQHKFNSDISLARLDASSNPSTTTAATATGNGVCRKYASMSSLSSASDAAAGAPPLHSNYQTKWATVTDQRPLAWATPDRTLRTKSRVTASPSGVLERGVVAGGSNAGVFQFNTDSGCSSTSTPGICLRRKNAQFSVDTSSNTLTISGQKGDNGVTTGNGFIFTFASAVNFNTMGASGATTLAAGDFVHIGGSAAGITDTICTVQANYEVTTSSAVGGNGGAVAGASANALACSAVSASQAALTTVTSGHVVFTKVASNSDATMDFEVQKPMSSDSATLPDFLKYFGYNSGGTATSQKTFLSISGCSSTAGIDGEYVATAMTATTITVSLNKDSAASGNAAIAAQDADAGVCIGNKVTISSRMGALVDSKAVAVGDRVTVVTAAGAHETRSVDKVWGSALDITTFSVVDQYSGTADLEDVHAWVDESGSTEKLECSRRGSCGDDGVCECYAGYTGDACSVQNALAS